jgi:hypothetical protein
MQKKKVVKKAKTIYALKITLRYCKPQIWRRVFVDANTKLPDLHKIIQTVMGWTNTHLHEFRIYNDVYCEPDEEIYHEYFDYTKVRLSDLVRRTGFKFYYDYDFGDGWEHEIKIEKIFTYDGDLKFPVCIDGKRRCPPEDCGGPWGYNDILKIIKDPEHKEYEEWMTWLGDYFDPDEFISIL